MRHHVFASHCSIHSAKTLYGLEVDMGNFCSQGRSEERPWLVFLYSTRINLVTSGLAMGPF
jgi:hypothetical protein